MKSRSLHFNVVNSPIAILLMLCVLLPACSDLVTPEHSGDQKTAELDPLISKARSVPDRISQDPVVQKVEGTLIELADRVHGFAGLHFQRGQDRKLEGDKLVVLITKEADSTSAKEQVRNHFNKQNIGVLFSPEQVVIKEASYSFKELQAVRDLVHDPVLNLDGVTSIDLSESRNRILIGVEREHDMTTVESVLTRIEVPRKAIKIHQTGEIRLSSTRQYNPSRENTSPKYTHLELTDSVRPLTGGLEIQNSCTIGIIATWNSKEVFITASHCTQQTGQLDDSNFEYYQPWSVIDSEVIGYEIHDPQNDYADAAIIEIENGVNYAWGTIAATNGRTQQWGNRAPREILHSPPRYKIEGERDNVYENMPVIKTGKYSGATIGYISDTCVTTNWEPGDDLICQHWADPMYLPGETGDSGSPVFTDYEINGRVELLGIAWGEVDIQNKGIFAPMTGVRDDLEGVQHTLVTHDPPIQVGISGLSYIDEDGIYEWDAVLQDAEPPVSYEWSIKWDESGTWSTLGTNSSQEVTIADGTDFLIKVEVSDSENSDTTSIPVVVEGECSPTEPPFVPCDT